MQVSIFVKNIANNKQFKLILDEIIVKTNLKISFFLSGCLKIVDGLILLLDEK